MSNDTPNKFEIGALILILSFAAAMLYVFFVSAENGARLQAPYMEEVKTIDWANGERP